MIRRSAVILLFALTLVSCADRANDKTTRVQSVQEAISNPTSVPTPSTDPPAPSSPTKPNATARQNFESKTAGDRKELVPEVAFRWCPAGKFTMGTHGAFDNESPVEVTLSSGFWLGETELTQGQWQKLMGTIPWQGQNSVKEGDDYAASYIGYGDAVALCNALTQQERNAGRLPNGWKYGLPTEAQWEYACRAGTTTKFSFGDSESELSEYGWWGGTFGDGNAQTEQYAHQVGRKKPNEWGLMDMHGNVYEWCSDWYEEKLVGGRDPVGTDSGSYRVNRGGGWYFIEDGCRSAKRNFFAPDTRVNGLGFRLAAVPVSD